MKRLLLLLSIPFAASQVMAQKTYQIRADSVRIYSGCDTAELILENRTKDTLGFLYNKGKGVTEFRKLPSETLRSVMERDSSTPYTITFNRSSSNPSNGLRWQYFTDRWSIFAEATQDDPPGNLIFLAEDNANEGWIFRHDGSSTGGQKTDLLSIGRDRLKYKGSDLFHAGNLNPVRGGTFETVNTDWNTLVNYSFVGSVNGTVNGPMNDGSWWNIISTRHRNGASDGTLYGLQIANGMTLNTNQHRIFFRSQGNGNWNAWKEFWHSANLRVNVETDSSLAIESWLRIPNRKGIKTADGALFYQPFTSSWAIRSTAAANVVWLELQTADGVGRGSVYGNSANEIGFTGPSGTNWRLKTDASGNTVIAGQVTATAFVQSSMRSLKKEINPFTANATEILKDAQVRTFVYKADSANIKHIGFIADELPEEMAAAERKGVDQANTVALLVKALQEMNAKVDALEKEVRMLKEEKALPKNK